MEIKDAITLYSFLGQLGWLGSIVFSILIALVAAFLNSTIGDKLTSDKATVRRTTTWVAVIILGCMITLSIRSNVNKERIDKANSIKSYMISEKRNWKGFREITQQVSFSTSDTAVNPQSANFKDRLSDIKKLISRFPEEFEISPIQNKDPADTTGVELIDTIAAKAINKYNESLIPLAKAKIMYYLSKNPGLDSISYGEIRSAIDDRFQDYLLDMMVVNNLDAFTPINMIRKGEIDGYGIKLKPQKPPKETGLQTIEKKGGSAGKIK